MKYSPTEFLKATANTAEHFGFRTVDNFKKDPLCKNCITSLPHTITTDEKTTHSYHGLINTSIANFCENNLHVLDSPILLYSVEQTPDSKDVHVAFNIFNVQKSIAEAILIQAGQSLIKDLGYSDHTVRINSLGDNESNTRYNRELTNFLRKRLDTIPVTARELMKDNPFKALAHLIEIEHDISYKAPNPLEYLSDQSRKHFREIIEYLDMTDTPYEIDPRMINNYDCFSDALFSIENNSLDEDGPTITIQGGRYDDFTYQKTRSKIPAVSTIISLKNNLKLPSRIPKSKSSNPDVFVVQLGFNPKIKSLMIIDELKRLGIPVRHNLSSDSLSAQLREAENSNVRYTIIIGQKEFIDQTVILRDMKERVQENISPEAMFKKLKKQLVLA